MGTRSRNFALPAPHDEKKSPFFFWWPAGLDDKKPEAPGERSCLIINDLKAMMLLQCATLLLACATCLLLWAPAGADGGGGPLAPASFTRERSEQLMGSILEDGLLVLDAELGAGREVAMHGPGGEPWVCTASATSAELDAARADEAAARRATEAAATAEAASSLAAAAVVVAAAAAASAASAAPPPAAVAVSARAALDAALSEINGVCLSVSAGWWTYEWCHRRWLRQYHLDERTQAPVQVRSGSGAWAR